MILKMRLSAQEFAKLGAFLASGENSFFACLPDQFRKYNDQMMRDECVATLITSKSEGFSQDVVIEVREFWDTHRAVFDNGKDAVQEGHPRFSWVGHGREKEGRIKMETPTTFITDLLQAVKGPLSKL